MNGGFLPDIGPLMVPLIGTAVFGLLLGAIVAIVLVRMLLRRESGSGTREIARAIEDLAEGRPERLPQPDPDEPMAGIHGALGNLAEALRRRQAEQDRRSAALQGLLDGADGIGFAGTDASGDIVLWSAGAREITGFSIEEVRGRPLERILTQDSWDALRPKLERRDPAGGRVGSESASLQRRGGGEIPVSLTLTLLEGGGPINCLVAFQDRSETEKIHRELRESEERLRRIVEGIEDGAFLARDGVMILASPSLAAMLEVGLSALQNRPLVEFVASEDLLRVRAHLERAQRGELVPAERIRLSSPPRDAHQSPARAILSMRGCILGGGRGVTGTLRLVDPVQDDLKQALGNESLLDATVESAADGLLVLAGPPGDRRVRVANALLAELLGLAGASMQHRDARAIATLLGGRFTDPADFASFFEALDADDVRTGRRTFVLAGSQPPRYIEAHTAPAREDSGRPVGRAWSFRDVTASLALAHSRDELEDTCRRLESVNERLAQRSAELDRVNGELQALDRMKSDLLANVSHELQTPLTAIKGYTELILKGKLGSVTNEQRRGLEVSQRNVDRLIVMIENLLSLARTERDLPAMRAITFPLWDLIEECVELLRESADRRHLSISTRYLTEDLNVRGDREKIAQVFLNLLSNAIKFSSEGGEIALTLRKGKKSFLIVEVRDTGIGIPAEDLERIFDRFYRAHENGPHADREGSGIGLTIVRDILRLHGCTIKADSRAGEGAVFTFTLPQAGSESRADGPGVPEGTPRGESEIPGGPEQGSAGQIPDPDRR